VAMWSAVRSTAVTSTEVTPTTVATTQGESARVPGERLEIVPAFQMQAVLQFEQRRSEDAWRSTSAIVALDTASRRTLLQALMSWLSVPNGQVPRFGSALTISLRSWAQDAPAL